ncbi:MAG: TRAP transporter small permease subunit [Saprospiraceae bacterium]|nr:TRAP transporter small permease subunit [Saprospiraceae bacterium]
MRDSLIKYIDRLVDRVGSVSGWLALFLILSVCIDVVLRLMDSSVTWLNDLQWHIFAALFLLGGAYTLQKDAHVRVDLFYSRFQAKDKALVNIIGILCLLMPWCLILMVYTLRFAIDSLFILEGSPDPNGLPFRFVIKFILFFSICLVFLQALSLLLKNLKQLKPKS